MISVLSVFAMALLAGAEPSAGQNNAAETLQWPAPGVQNFGESTYATFAEAIAHAPPVPNQCRAAMGTNLCVSTAIPEDQPLAGAENRVVWRPGPWVPPDLLRCLDAATADTVLACDDPLAARVIKMGPPPIIVVAPASK